MSAKGEGLRAAAAVLADVMRVVAATKSEQASRVVNWYMSAEEEAVVAAGYPVGRYGWEPIQALMFDDNKRHPLFGHGPWYHEGYFPITEGTVELGADDAAESFADAYLDLFLEEHGFK